ncbi:MAG: hypothetical protein K5888_05405 [Lachnospiraceae bacterium]|nr:hypothetical protein [Lachnospiraceae bacterium]
MKNKVLVAMGIGIFAALTFNAASVTTLADDNNEPQNPDENNGYNFDDEMEEAVKAANDSKAGEIVDGASVVIEGAGSPEEAEAAMNTAQQAADNADADVKASEKRISDIEAELDDLSKEYKAKVALYEEKVGQLNDAKKRFEEAKTEAVADSEALVAEIADLQQRLISCMQPHSYQSLSTVMKVTGPSRLMRSILKLKAV